MWRTARRQRTTGTVVRVGLLAAAVVTIAGLLAMHALSLHGTRADGEHASLSLPAVHAEHTHALDHADRADRAGHAGPGTPSHLGGPGGEGHSAMMLCAAFLLAAGVLLLSGLWRRTPVWWFARGRSWSRTAGSTPLVAYSATGPPSVWAYSVIRC
ncbi:DUF6153 family protein [Nocardioides albus]|uniref:Uncharacterized protein n=1 Tax=Nocardioides albus TaxID=1841 RepID=A0A7W5A4Q1_9ACTN|nr:DUF6153 family protein [Nocardioides albus]MBB3089641.1 hypothetical protein [Nocardioides albus]GGU30449.1 hypothetical protein GCM10007979_31490 [Nocardioides albus]